MYSVTFKNEIGILGNGMIATNKYEGKLNYYLLLSSKEIR